MLEPKSNGALSPGTLPLRSALDRSAPLSNLLQRLRESGARFAAIQDALPPALQRQVRPGPLDEQGWSLLVSNGAAASKLRHLLPTLEAALLAKGWQRTPIRIKVQSAAVEK